MKYLNNFRHTSQMVGLE